MGTAAQNMSGFRVQGFGLDVDASVVLVSQDFSFYEGGPIKNRLFTYNFKTSELHKLMT